MVESALSSHKYTYLNLILSSFLRFFFNNALQKLLILKSENNEANLIYVWPIYQPFNQ